MADSSATQLRTSKRKRAPVNYYEEPESDDEKLDFSGEEEEGEESDAEARSRPKKRKTVSLKPLPKKKIFPFLSLPAEIRNEIYRYSLHDPAGVYLFPTTEKFRRTVYRVTEASFRGQPPPIRSSDSSDDEDGLAEQERPSDVIGQFVPALLAVCKQIHTEARDILYDHNFYVQDTLTLHSFLVDLGPRAAGYLKNVTLGDWGRGRGVNKAYNHACFTALAAATNLKRFTFYGILSCEVAAKPAASIFYRDAFPWLEAVGAAKGQPDAALNMIEIMVPWDGENFYGRLSSHWGHWQHRMSYKVFEEMDGFRKELGKLLNARMDRIRS